VGRAGGAAARCAKGDASAAEVRLEEAPLDEAGRCAAGRGRLDARPASRNDRQMSVDLSFRGAARSRPDPVGVAWLIRLRWGAALTIALAVIIAELVFAMGLRLSLLLGLIVPAVLSNVWLEGRRRRASPAEPALLGAVLLLDALTLTALLYFSGGPTNPFSSLFLVYITLAAVLLGTRWTFAILGVCVLSFGLLFVDHVPVSALSAHGGTSATPSEHAGHAGHAGHAEHAGNAGSGDTIGAAPARRDAGFDGHLYGMFVAFAASATLIAAFVTRLSEALRAREGELSAAREKAGRLASLTTLAAGAAHELGTPLGTIAVAARELAGEAKARGCEAMSEDALLIRAEASRCRAILDRMATRAGGATGEAPTTFALAELFEELRESLGERRASLLECEPLSIASAERRPRGAEGADPAQPSSAEAMPGQATLPRKTVTQVLDGLVRNGLDASPSGARVTLRARAWERRLRFEVIDRGEGMDSETLRRAGEPFFTTKDPGRGMGLGLFLAKTVAEQLGGTLAIDSRLGEGTTVALELPLGGAR